MFLDKGPRVINHDRIPGLQQPPTSGDFVRARQECASRSFIYNVIANACSHNNLPNDDALLKVEEKILNEHLPQLKLLFKRFNVEKLFAVYIPHRHSKVPDGFHLVGQTKIFDGLCYYWTRTVANDTLNSNKVCGRKFIFDKQQGWRPCDFHEGSAPDLSKVKPEFFLELTNYLVKHDLTSTLGLEYIVPELLLIFNMLEFILPNCGLLLVEATSLQFNYATTVTTSWGWSHPIFTREIRCIPDRDKKHQPVAVDYQLQESHTSINDIIRAFMKG